MRNMSERIFQRDVNNDTDDHEGGEANVEAEEQAEAEAAFEEVRSSQGRYRLAAIIRGGCFSEEAAL